MFYLSQAHLQRFVKCPPEFQQFYLQQLASPVEPEHLEKQAWGTKFHLVMQQLQLDFSLDQIVDDLELKIAVQSLLEKIPEFLETQTKEISEAEYRRTLKIEQFLLTIICDWIIFKPDSIEIYDWKTYRKPQESKYLQNHWQTKLYLYLLAETTDYNPDQISMTYWFVKSGEEPQSLTFQYTQARHQEVHQELTEILTRLQENLDDYFNNKIPLKHHDKDYCKCCQNQLLSGENGNLGVRRSPESEIFEGKSLEEFLANIEEIEV